MKKRTSEAKQRQKECAPELQQDDHKPYDPKWYFRPLYETMIGLINRLDINDLLTAIIHRAAELVNTEHAFIYLVKPQENLMEIILGIGKFHNFRFQVLKGEGMVGRVWQSGKPLMINRYCDWEGRVHHPFFDALKAALVVPLIGQSGVIGVVGLVYFEENRMFEERQMEMLSRFAELASLVLENAQLFTKVKQDLAMREHELSGLQKMLAQAMGISKVGIFSDTMQQIILLAQKYHENRTLPVLIEGETGTGKELVAKTIHFGDMANPGPFIGLNCATIPAHLFESELFGYEAGSFTGAMRGGQKGKFDLAKGGTLFLDEITELPLEMQPKLLRVIQEKEFFRVGGLHKVKTDVRIICDTNVDLAKRVEQGRFRKDLYFRLKVGHIFVPSLRERKKEIIPLAFMFLKEFSASKAKKFKRISEPARRILMSYDWPGNVRELRNVIELIVALHDDEEVQPVHLTMKGPLSETCFTDREVSQPLLGVNNFVLPSESFSLQNLVDKLIREAIKKHQGNKTAAANYLRVSRRSIYYHLNRKKPA